MKLEEIKTAVRQGKEVKVGSEAYRVNLHVFPDGREQWLIQCTLNDYCIGLTWADGVTLNGEPSEFYVGTRHAQDKTDYARAAGYQGEKRVLVSDGKVISHRGVCWFAFCAGLRQKSDGVVS